MPMGGGGGGGGGVLHADRKMQPQVIKLMTAMVIGDREV